MESADNPKSVSNFGFSTVPLDSFIIDMDNFSNSSTDHEISHNSTITMNFSRKGTLNKIGQDHDADDDTGEFISPIGGVALGAVSTLEKKPVGLGPGEELGGGGGGGFSGVEKASFRRNSFKRSSQTCSWYLNPRKIFLFCATLSCVGTMVLIYFAFSSGMMNVADEIRQLDS